MTLDNDSALVDVEALAPVNNVASFPDYPGWSEKRVRVDHAQILKIESSLFVGTTATDPRSRVNVESDGEVSR